MNASIESSGTGFELLSSLRYDPILLSSSDNSDYYRFYCRETPIPFYLLQLHKDRMFAAAQHFGWDEAISKLKGDEGFEGFKQSLLVAVAQHQNPNTPLKLRVLLSRTGSLKVEASETPSVTLENLFPSKLLRHETSTPSSKTGGALLLGSHEQASNSSANALNTGPWHVYLDTSCTPMSEFTRFKTTSRNMYTDARARAGIKSYQAAEEVLLINNKNEIMDGSFTSVYFFRSGRWVTPQTKYGGSGGLEGTTRRWLLETCRCSTEIIKTDSIIDGEECYLSNAVRGFIYGRISLRRHDSPESRAATLTLHS